MTVQLSADRPDYEDILQQLSTNVQSRSDAWRDLLNSSTGTILLDLLAGIGSFSQFNIERAVQEVSGFDSAVLPTSVYTLALMLGVSPKRRVSARTRVTLSIEAPYPSSVTIPAYNQFDIDGVVFYNPEDITIAAGATGVSDVLLSQGQIITRSSVGTGATNQQISVSSGFVADENFFRVTVDNSAYIRERVSLAKYGSLDNAFLERTQPDGTIKIIFGNGLFGTVPGPSQLIQIIYADSIGKDANTAQTNLPVKLSSVVNTVFGQLTVVGFNTDAISGGADQESVDELRFTAPRLFASAERCITRQDWKAISLQFPSVDIADINVWAEFEDFTGENSRMNVVRLVILPESGGVFSSQNYSDFLTFISTYKHVTTAIKILDPIQVNVGITANIYYKLGYDPNGVQNAVQSAISDLFSLKIGSLGRAYYLSEIYQAIQSVDGVDFVELLGPTSDLILDKREYANLNSTTINMITSTRS